MKEFVKKAANTVSSQYLEDGVDPTEALAKFASGRDLNANQIERIATQANRDIIVELSKEAVQQDCKTDPHFTFPKVKTADVIGLIKKSPSRPGPTLPQKPEHHGLDDIMPPPDAPGGNCSNDQAERIVGQKTVSMSFPNKEVAYKVIEKIKEEADKKRRIYDSLCNKLESAQLQLSKQAERQILNGTPLEVLESVPGGDDVFRKVAQKHSDDVVYDDTEFELDYDHPIVKTAQKIEELEERVAEAQQNLEFEQERLKNAKHNARAL